MPLISINPQDLIHNLQRTTSRLITTDAGYFGKISHSLPSSVWYGGGCLAILFFLLYFITMPLVNVSYGDSDQLLTVAYNLGVAAPPGYSLYIIFLHFFTNLSIPGTVAFKGHLLSALLHSGALVLVFAGVWRTLEYFVSCSKKKNIIISETLDRWWISIIATTLLGSSYLYWLYGIIAEKYALLDLMIAILLYSVVTILTTEATKIPSLLWVVLGGVYGLLLLYYPPALLLLPMLGLFIWYERNTIKPYVLHFLGSLIVGLSFSLVLLVWLNTLQVNVSYHFPNSALGFVNHLLQSNFGTTEESTAQFTSMARTININASIQSIPAYVTAVIQHFGIIPIALVFLGVYVSVGLAKRFSYTLLLGILLTAVVLPLYLLWSKNFTHQAFVMRNYLVGYMFFPIFLSLGLWIAFARIRKALSILSTHKQALTISLLFVSLVIVGWQVWQTYSATQLKSFTLNSRFNHSILAGLPSNSILGCFTDTTCSGLLYEQEINGFRRDVTVVPAGSSLVSSRLEKRSDLRGFSYTKEPFVMFDYLTWNIGKRPVYVVDIQKQYHEVLGFDFGFTYYIPYGYYGQLVREIPQTIPTPSYQLSQDMKDTKVPSQDLMMASFKARLARMHIFNSSIYMKMGKRIEARDELNIAANLLYQLPQVLSREVEATRSNIESSSPSSNYTPGSTVQSVDEILGYVQTYLDKDKLGMAYRGALGTVAIDPMSEKARIILAQIYKRMGDMQSAKVEYENVLRYYPENPEAKAKIQEIVSQRP